MRTMNVKGLTLFHLKSHLQVSFCYWMFIIIYPQLNHLFGLTDSHCIAEIQAR